MDAVVSQGKEPRHSASGRQRRRFNPPLKRDSQPSQVLSQGGQLAPTAKGSCNTSLQHLAIIEPRGHGRQQYSSNASPRNVCLPQAADSGCTDGAGETRSKHCKTKYAKPKEKEEKRRSHTVLSYCEDDSLSPPEVPSQPAEWLGSSGLHDSLSCDGGSFPQGSYPDTVEELNRDEDSQVLFTPGGQIQGLLSPELDSQNDTEPSDHGSFPRRQFKVPKMKPTSYNFSIFGKHPAPPRGGTRKAGGKYKKVQLKIPREKEGGGEGGGRGGEGRWQPRDGGALEVFNFKSTQEEAPPIEGTNIALDEAKSSKHNMSVTGRSREEQLAVEAEVLQVIARTRTEIKAIRAKYAATRAARIPWVEPALTHQTLRCPIRGNYLTTGSHQARQGGNKLVGGYDLIAAAGRRVQHSVSSPMAQEE